MAMRIKFGAQITNHIWSHGFFSCSGRVSINAPNIRCANKLARCKQENFVWSASPNCNVIAYSFCLRERKRKYVLYWQIACSKWKWISIATVPDLCPTIVKILTHLISRYQLPLTSFAADPLCTHKICQLFSWPGLKGSIRILTEKYDLIRNDLKSRIRIRATSFRIHNAVLYNLQQNF
jgi:hypothetical protein